MQVDVLFLGRLEEDVCSSAVFLRNWGESLRFSFVSSAVEVASSCLYFVEERAAILDGEFSVLRRFVFAEGSVCQVQFSQRLDSKDERVCYLLGVKTGQISGISRPCPFLEQLLELSRSFVALDA